MREIQHENRGMVRACPHNPNTWYPDFDDEDEDLGLGNVEEEDSEPPDCMTLEEFEQLYGDNPTKGETT